MTSVLPVASYHHPDPAPPGAVQSRNVPEGAVIDNLEAHPAALILPRMNTEEFAELVYSMRRQGYDSTKPIILHEGKILDGCSRYLAAAEAGVKPVFAEWEPVADDTQVLFVLRSNLTRRHLTQSQKAFVALEADEMLAESARSRQGQRNDLADIAEKFPQSERGRARDQAADLVGVNPHYVTDAKKIQEASPQLAEEVWRGQLSIPAARRKLKASLRPPTPPTQIDTPSSEVMHYDLARSIASVRAQIVKEMALATEHNQERDFVAGLQNLVAQFTNSVT